MLKGLGFFIKQGWKYDKRYIIWNILYQFVHSFIPVVAAIMPKFMIDELFDAKRMDKLILYMSILIGYLLIGTALSVYFQKDGFTRRCKVSAEFDSNLHERLYKADFENLENPLFLDKQEKAKNFSTVTGMALVTCLTALCVWSVSSLHSSALRRLLSL